jgi:DNA invertase Pin-like site-specific DNA recombinase
VVPITRRTAVATLGYTRVSTTGQNLEAQLAVLGAAGVDPARVFTDTLSGSANTARPGLAAMLDYARPGDTLVVVAIDRLGRSVAKVTIAELGERAITLRALREGVDTATPTGRAVAAIMSTLAELELELGRERRAASRQSRRTMGCRPPSRPSSAQPGKNSYGVSPRPVNPCVSSLKHSESGGQPRTATYPSSSHRPLYDI